MADRPIIFSGPMVQALLAGRKSQTRRVLKPQPDFRGGVGDYHDAEEWGWEDEDGYHVSVLDICPNGFRVGDRLWVREAFIGPYAYEVNEYPPRDWGNKAIWFPADGPVPEKHAGQFWHRARPSIHMPRWASRLTLTVTDVRVQRLQDISEADAVAEGCDAVLALTIKRPNGAHPGNPRECYCDLWNSLHGPGAWDANPWVVAVTFTVQRGNIDQIGDAK
mgnify:CR=1 FL=1